MKIYTYIRRVHSAHNFAIHPIIMCFCIENACLALHLILRAFSDIFVQCHAFFFIFLSELCMLCRKLRRKCAQHQSRQKTIAKPGDGQIRTKHVPKIVYVLMFARNCLDIQNRIVFSFVGQVDRQTDGNSSTSMSEHQAPRPRKHPGFTTQFVCRRNAVVSSLAWRCHCAFFACCCLGSSCCFTMV